MEHKFSYDVKLYGTAKYLFHAVLQTPLTLNAKIAKGDDVYEVVEIAHALSPVGYELTETNVYVKIIH
jgi:hypothetical protein